MKDITRRVFGRLQAVKFSHRSSSGKYYWECLCACGKRTVVRKDHLVSGATKSCGCLNKEVARETGRIRGSMNVKHGGEGSRLYNIWHHMKERCLNHKHVNYRNYGGKGISVCEEWSNDFSAFRDWAEKNGYEEGLTIDRIDGDKGYSPTNCRWATYKQQGRNRKTNRIVQGKTIAEWAENASVSANSIRVRLRKGWSIEDACSIPPGRKPDD